MSKEVGTFDISDIDEPWWECVKCKKRVKYGKSHEHARVYTYKLRAGQIIHIGGFPVKITTDTMVESGSLISEETQ